MLIRAQNGNIYNLAHIEGIEVVSKLSQHGATHYYEVEAHWEGHHEALSSRGRPSTSSLVLARAGSEEVAKKIMDIILKSHGDYIDLTDVEEGEAGSPDDTSGGTGEADT
ncbi:MAG: hypothetical protein M3347_13645 [Armatimonadota bacterium]|nr:hypothetical protein [Armatimonadota bacterium]